MRRAPQITSVKHGQGGRRGKKGIGRYLVGGLVAMVLALFGGVIWFAYQDLMPGSDEAPPVIRADASPLKREPDERGGLPLLNDESAVVQGLNEPESPVRVERIMPRESVAPRSTADVIPEALEAEPLSDTDLADTELADTGLVVATAGTGAGPEQAGDASGGAEDETGDTLDSLLAEIVDGEDALSAIEPTAGPVAPNPAVPNAPGTVAAEVDDVPQPADGLALPESDVAALTSPSAAASAVGAPATAANDAAAPAATLVRPAPEAAATRAIPATTAAPAAGPTRTTAALPAAPASPAAAAPAAPVTTPRAPAPAETTVAALPRPALAQSFDGAFGVQLLAVRDEAAAAGAWTGLQQQHAAVLGGLQSRVQRADIGGNTFYRLQAGPFEARADANAVCAALQARGIDCFIVEPTS